MNRKKPLKPTAFARKQAAPMARTGILAQSSFARTKASDEKPKRAMKSRGPKMTPIRASARDEECTLRFPDVCNRRTDTTVLCHSNRLEDGKGMGLKAPDLNAAYGCEACHAVLDGRACRWPNFTYEQMIERFLAAVEVTHERLRAKGLMP